MDSSSCQVNENLDYDIDEVRLELVYHPRMNFIGSSMRSLRALPLPEAVQTELDKISDVFRWVFSGVGPIPIEIYEFIAASLPYASSYFDVAERIINQLEAKLMKIREDLNFNS